MPIYEYGCGSCGHTLEALQKLSDRPLRKCPECGRQTLKRLMSAPAFRLKGGGWYETDFKADGEKKRNLAEQSKDEAPEPKAADGKAKDAKATPDKGAAAKEKETKSAAKDTKRGAKAAGKNPGSEAALR